MVEESLYDHADLYDLVMADVAPEGQAGFYLRQAQACGGPVLELACGTGRLALPIAAAGFDTTGLDASAAMLAGAERKARESGLPVGEYRHVSFGELTLEEATDYDAASQVSRTLWYFSAPDRRDSIVVQLSLRSIFPQELPLLVSAGGLRLERRFGDFHGGRFDSRSRNQICVCRTAA